jgi:sugar/nucleoside kinase (ribokinase family)
MAPPSVLLAGHVTLDRHGAALLPGGAVYYAGLAYAGLGAQVRVATRAGPDFPGAALAGAEVHVQPAALTTLFAAHHDAAGARTQRVEAVAPPVDASDLPVGWREADLLHLAPVLAELDLAAWRAAVRAPFVGLQIQGCVRALAPDGRVVQPRWEPAPAALAGLSAAVLGEDDLVGQGDLVARLAAAVPVVAFTHGARGAEVLVGGRTLRVGVHPAHELDPTGAGDAFAAAFFLALASGAEPVEAARLGAAAGSIAVEGRGGEALARMGEVRDRARRVPVLDP